MFAHYCHINLPPSMVPLVLTVLNTEGTGTGYLYYKRGRKYHILSPSVLAKDNVYLLPQYIVGDLYFKKEGNFSVSVIFDEWDFREEDIPVMALAYITEVIDPACVTVYDRATYIPADIPIPLGFTGVQDGDYIITPESEWRDSNNGIRYLLLETALPNLEGSPFPYKLVIKI